jgi:hypothetical protein
MTGYKYQAQELMRDYLLADPLVPYTSVLVGIALCKMVISPVLVVSTLCLMICIAESAQCLSPIACLCCVD